MALVAEFAANNAAAAAGRGNPVAKFVPTSGTGRRVRRVHRGLVAWSQSSPWPGHKVAGGSQRVKGTLPGSLKFVMGSFLESQVGGTHNPQMYFWISLN